MPYSIIKSAGAPVFISIQFYLHSMFKLRIRYPAVLRTISVPLASFFVAFAVLIPLVGGPRSWGILSRFFEFPRAQLRCRR